MLFYLSKSIRRAIIVILLFGLMLVAAYIYFIVNYPLVHKNTIMKYSEKYGLDPYLIAAIINVESRYDKNAISRKEARGLMQISPVTGYWAAKELGIDDFSLDMLFDPEVNIMIGTWYLNVLSQEFGGNLQLMLAAYNAGSGNVYKWLNDKRYSKDGKSLSKIPFQETREYVDKVYKNIKVYQVLYKDKIHSTSDRDDNYFVLLFTNNLRRVIRNFAIYK
ncbi:MAG: lytic transglycosylase domain-containing protein [Tissierellales bacterium]